MAAPGRPCAAPAPGERSGGAASGLPGGAARGGPGAGGGAGPALGGRGCGTSGGRGQRGPGSALAPVPAPRPCQRGCHAGQCPAAPALLAVRKGSEGISAGCEMPEGWAQRGEPGFARCCLRTGPGPGAPTETLSERKGTLFSVGG